MTNFYLTSIISGEVAAGTVLCHLLNVFFLGGFQVISVRKDDMIN